MRTLIHDPKDLQDIPESVQCVLRQLAQPSTGYVIPEGEDFATCRMECEHRLHSVRDIITSLSISFSALARIHDECGPQRTTAIWHLFFRMVATACFEESLSIGELSIESPAGTLPTEHTAMMLVSYATRNVKVGLTPQHSSSTASRTALNDDAEPCMCVSKKSASVSDTEESRCDEESADTSELESEEESDVDPDDSNDTDYSYEPDDSGESEDVSDSNGRPRCLEDAVDLGRDPLEFDRSQIPKPWSLEVFGNILDSSPPKQIHTPLDLPRDAHILSGLGPWSHLLLPIVCIADADAIVPVLASAAHQRWVWNIDLPVVGVEVEKDGSRARVYLAWLDPLAQMDPDLHVVRAGEGADPSVFDMTDLNSAILLAQFLVSLRYQFLVLHDAIPSTQPHSLNWRCDSVRPNTGDSYQFIRDWVKKSSDNTGTSISSSSPLGVSSPESNICSYHTSNTTMSSKSTGVRGKARSKGKVATPAASTPAPSVGASLQAESLGNTSNEDKDAAKKKGAAKDKVVPKTPSRFSASAFATEKLHSLSEKVSMSSWMVHRSAVDFAVMKLSETDTTRDRDFVNRMVDEYNNTTDFRWSDRWELESSASTAMLSLGPHCAHFVQAYETLLKSKPETHRPLQDELVPIMEANLWAVFAAVSATRAKESSEVERNEAESRPDWDGLLFRFFNDNIESRSPYVLLERTIEFPANPLSRALSSNTAEREFATRNLLQVLSHWSFQCGILAHTLRLSDVPTPDTLLRQANNASRASGEALQSYSDLIREDSLRLTVLEQEKKEPSNGICDAMLYFPVDLDAFVPSEGVAFRLVICSSKTSPKKSKAASSELFTPFNTPSSHPDEAATSQVHSTHPDLPELALLTPSTATRLRLPALMVEYKKSHHNDIFPALNQTRMYCISAVHFLAEIGIREWPVYGLVTSGKKGAILMASMLNMCPRQYTCLSGTFAHSTCRMSCKRTSLQRFCFGCEQSKRPSRSASRACEWSSNSDSRMAS